MYDYDEIKENSYMFYLDFNTDGPLPLPYSGLEYVEDVSMNINQC